MISINGVGLKEFKQGVIDKQALSAASETVAKGIYDATTLSAVDADLAAANIKLGTTIFGFLGALAPGGVETYEKYYSGNLAPGANYTPTDPGIFSNCGGIRGTPEYYSTGAGVWYSPYNQTVHEAGMGIGDGSNYHLHNYHGSNTYEQCLFRHHFSTGAYERNSDAQLVAGASYIPSDEGYFVQGAEDVLVELQGNMTVTGWQCWREAQRAVTIASMCCGIGDGTNLRVNNTAGGARRYVLMRAIMS